MRAAVALADAEGLEAVSLRGVAAELNAGFMRLYGHVSTKQELLELMGDHVYGEVMAAGPLASGKWRRALTDLARRLREASLAHPWFSIVLAGRQRAGPNALVFTEAALEAISHDKAFARIDVALSALRALNAYVLGAIASEAAERQARIETGLTEAQWRRQRWPAMAAAIASGKFPQIERVVRDAEHADPEEEFEDGLQYLLDGIASHLL